MEKEERVTLWTIGIMAAAVLLKKTASLPQSPQALTGKPIDEDQTGVDSIAASVWDFMTGDKYKDFVLQITPVADQIKREFSIEPRILIAQSALESNWGTSGLTRTANNLFGFTGDSWAREKKPVIFRQTREHSNLPPDKISYWNLPGDIVSKADDGQGGTWAVVERPFRAYLSWYESAKDWANLLNTPRYATALSAAKAGDLNQFALLIKESGYATDPNYPTLIVKAGQKAESIMTA